MKKSKCAQFEKKNHKKRYNALINASKRTDLPIRNTINPSYPEDEHDVVRSSN